MRRHRDDFLILIPLKLGVRISRSPNPKVMVKVGKSVYLLVARSPILLSYRQVEALVFTNILSYRSRPAKAGLGQPRQPGPASVRPWPDKPA